MRRWIVAVALVLPVAACADDPTDDDAAVEAMVLETCAPGGGVADEAVCRCAYDRLLDEYGSEELARLDGVLRQDLDALPSEARRIVLDCAFGLVVPDIPPPPTTVPPTTVPATTVPATTVPATTGTAGDATGERGDDGDDPGAGGAGEPGTGDDGGTTTTAARRSG